MATQPAKKPNLAAVPAPLEAAWKPVGASAKLAYIQAHVDFVPKTGTNTHQKFDYFQEHGVLACLRPFQRDLHVAIIIDIYDVVVEGNMTSGVAKVMLVDTDAASDYPDRAVWGRFPMQATDNQGWGAAKLQTYAKKFALQKFFGIPTEELPEAEREAIAIALGEERPIQLSDPAEFAGLRQSLTDGNADPKRVRAKLVADFKCQTIGDLLPSQLEAFKAWVLLETAKVES